jgi:hypothetical protein
MDLSVKCVCPSCFSEIYLGECRIVSGVTGNVLKEPKGVLARMRVEPLDGRTYTLELARRECTNNQCRYLLPPNTEKVPSITLVVVGDTFSGKSHYIAALIHQLKTEWLSNSTGFARFLCLTPDVEQTYIKEYFEPLFTQQQSLAPTQKAKSPYAKPLIYKLVVSLSPKHPTITTNLMIYDTSGEDFELAHRLVGFARFVLNTSAFIFVADPFTMPPIFKTLPPNVQALIRGRTAAERLNAIIDVYEQYHGHPVGSRFPDLPIAVMVSKSDLFKNQHHSATFMRNPFYGNGIDLTDINNVDWEVRELLKKYQQGDLLAATSRFKKLKFFATSATGEPPDASGQFAQIEPCRCLDPVLWILHQLGIIKAN